MRDACYTESEILRDLRSFKPTIHISHYNPQALMDKVLTDNPEVLYYVQRMSGSIRIAPMGKMAEYTVSYVNTGVEPKCITRARTVAEIEGAMHKSIGKYLGTLVVCVPASLNVDRVYSDFLVAYQGFYSNLTEISSQVQSFAKYSVSFVTFKFKYRIGRVQLNIMEKAVDREVERLSHILFAPEMSKEVKAYIAHNYLAREVEYWLKEDANPLEKSYMQSAYGALINHRCVCQGYAEAYKRLLNSQGIICEVVCGKIRKSSEHHAWNVVSFDGRIYYHVDVTWDSPAGDGISLEYFCKSDDYLNGSRIWTRCRDVYCSDSTDIMPIIRRQVAMKKASFAARGIEIKYL